MPTRPVLVLGDQPQPLVLRVTRGEPATLAAALRDTDQQPRPWAPPVSLVLDDTAGTRFDATLEDDLATWNLTADQVAAAVAAERVRIEEAGITVAAGFVADSDAFHAGHRGNAFQVERVRRGSPGKEPPPTDITIGEVTTLPTGVGASASVRGVAPNLILDLRLPKGAKGDPWDAEAQAQAQGFWMVVSDTPPTETTKYGVPVVWVQRSTALTEVPAVPPQPSWNLNLGQVTVADPVGAYYVLTTNVDPTPRVLAPGVATSVGSQRPIVATVEAKAKSGYYLASTMRWSKQFLDFNAMTIIASDDFTGPAGPLVTGSKASGGMWTIGRQMNNVLGGTTPVAWKKYDTYTSLELDGNGLLTPPAAGGDCWMSFDVGGLNQYVELDVLRGVRTHGAGLTMLLQGTSGYGAVTITAYFDAGSGWVVRLQGTGQDIKNKIGWDGTIPFVGKWKVWVFNNVASVQTPAGDVFSIDNSAVNSSALGTHFSIRTGHNAAWGATTSAFDNIRVGKW